VEPPRRAALPAADTAPIASPSPPPSSSPVLNNLTAPSPLAPREVPAPTADRPPSPEDAGSVLNNLTATAATDGTANDPTADEWVLGGNLHTVALIQAGNGRAHREQVRAALWADLEALGG